MYAEPTRPRRHSAVGEHISNLPNPVQNPRRSPDALPPSDLDPLAPHPSGEAGVSRALGAGEGAR